jgi:hypothetical protein
MLLDRDDRDPEALWRSWAHDVVDADENLRRKIEEFWANAPREAKVGTRHHTVPKFYLRRFASKDKLLVRDRSSGEMTTRNIDDLAIKNFYTFVNNDGEEDGRLEDILAAMEGGTSDLLNRVFGAFQPVRKLDPGESMALALYLSFQVVRTPRHRREMELLADYSTKLINQHRLSNPTEWVMVPHPNLHISYMGSAAFKLAETLYGRPVTLVTLDRPLFITCDEPVILAVEGDHVRHVPACFKTTKQRIKASKRPSRHRRRNWDIVHCYPSRPGLGQATAVAVPISPRSILVLGPKTSPAPLHVRLNGVDATEFADEVNRRLIDQAYVWAAANPDHATFADMEFPPPQPILRACDGGTAMARALDRPPEKRNPERLSNTWR